MPPARGPAPCRSLEELVAQLDELEKAGVEGGGQGCLGRLTSLNAPSLHACSLEVVRSGQRCLKIRLIRSMLRMTCGHMRTRHLSVAPTAVPRCLLLGLQVRHTLQKLRLSRQMLRKLRLDEEHQMSQVAADEPEWLSQFVDFGCESAPASTVYEPSNVHGTGLERKIGVPLRWDHLGYLRRSPSPCRLRTTT